MKTKKSFTMSMGGNSHWLRKWDVLRLPDGTQSIVIRVRAGAITSYPYKTSKWKFWNRIVRMWIRIKVFLRLI